MATTISSDIYAEHATKASAYDYHITYNFGTTVESADSIGYPNIIQVYPDDSYSPKKGYGFLTEEIRKEDSKLSAEQLNDGFITWPWHTDSRLITPAADENGVYLENGIVDGGYVPLTFKAHVPKQGNYKVTLVLSAGDTPINGVTIFSGRRRLESLKGDYCPHEVRAYVFNVNVCDVVIDGQLVKDNDLEITIIGNRPVFTSLTIEEVDTPTIFIAGGSAVADQPACYPYRPEISRCGFGQFFSYYVSNLAASSNLAAIDASTESFMNDDHYTLLKSSMKKNDFCLLHFGLEDFTTGVDAKTTYAKNLEKYIKDIQSLGATALVATPVARNTWNEDGTYNDILADYAEECKKVAAKTGCPLIDLHTVSMDFIIRNGKQSTARYFYPDSEYYLNDFGAYIMAGYTAKEIKKYRETCPIPIRTSLCGKVYDEALNSKRAMTMEELMESDNYVPPMNISLPTA